MSAAAGLCQCGCGRRAPLAQKTRADRGHLAGQPTPFVRGHAGGLSTRRAAQRGLVAAATAAAESYAERLAHASELVVAAVHDEGPAETWAQIAGALAIAAPPGVDPVIALITVLAAQVDPDTTTSARLGWVENTPARPRSPGPTTRNRGAA